MIIFVVLICGALILCSLILWASERCPGCKKWFTQIRTNDNDGFMVYCTECDHCDWGEWIDLH